jgi:hypothetical protein
MDQTCPVVHKSRRPQARLKTVTLCQTLTGQDVWQVVRRDGGQVDGKWMADA